MKKLSLVVMLTLALVVVAGTAVFAAPEGSNVISNELTETFLVPEAAKGVVAEDFGVMNLSGVKGYTVGFHLTNATIDDVESIQVSLYKDGTLLQTNTANVAKFKAEYPEGTQFSSPFDVFGEFDYSADGFWTPGSWNADVSELTVPNKAEIKVTFADGIVATAENSTLTGDPTSIIPEQLITLSWGEGQQFTVTGSPFQVTVSADSKYRIDRVLYVVEVTGTGDFEAIALDGQALGKDPAGFWYWGPRTGFTFNRGTVTTTFDVTADPGTYSVKIYAVQLLP